MKSNCKIYFLLILFFALAGKEFHAQNRNIDSLLILLKTDKPDTNKVNHLKKLSLEYGKIGELDTSMKYGNNALALASSILFEGKRGWPNGIASGYTNIGVIYSIQGNYPAALKKFFDALKIMEAIGNKKGVAFAYNNIGIMYFRLGNYSEGLKNHFA